MIRQSRFGRLQLDFVTKLSLTISIGSVVWQFDNMTEVYLRRQGMIPLFLFMILPHGRKFVNCADMNMSLKVLHLFAKQQTQQAVQPTTIIRKVLRRPTNSWKRQGRIWPAADVTDPSVCGTFHRKPVCINFKYTKIGSDRY